MENLGGAALADTAAVLVTPSQVIQLHNAFLSAALERSLLEQSTVVLHIHKLLAVAKELANVVKGCDTEQSGKEGSQPIS